MLYPTCNYTTIYGFVNFLGQCVFFPLRISIIQVSEKNIRSLSPPKVIVDKSTGQKISPPYSRQAGKTPVVTKIGQCTGNDNGKKCPCKILRTFIKSARKTGAGRSSFREKKSYPLHHFLSDERRDIQFLFLGGLLRLGWLRFWLLGNDPWSCGLGACRHKPLFLPLFLHRRLRSDTL